MAVAALPLLLSAVAITDLAWAAAGLVDGRLTVPIGLVLALWAFAAAPESERPRELSSRAIGLAALMVAASLGPMLASALFASGGPLVAGENDLRASGHVDRAGHRSARAAVNGRTAARRAQPTHGSTRRS